MYVLIVVADAGDDAVRIGSRMEPVSAAGVGGGNTKADVGIAGAGDEREVVRAGNEEGEEADRVGWSGGPDVVEWIGEAVESICDIISSMKFSIELCASGTVNPRFDGRV